MLLVLAWAAILLLSLAMAGLLRQVQALAAGPSRTVVSGPRLGLAAPRLDELGVSRDDDVVLMFVSSGCSTCSEILSRTDEWHRSAISIRLLVISREELAEDALIRVDHVVHFDPLGRIFDDYGIRATPFMVHIRHGVVVRAERVGSPSLATHFLLEAREGVSA
jgi:hypothetical protein